MSVRMWCAVIALGGVVVNEVQKKTKQICLKKKCSIYAAEREEEIGELGGHPGHLGPLGHLPGHLGHLGQGNLQENLQGNLQKSLLLWIHLTNLN